jgi:hypothetical protein
VFGDLSTSPGHGSFARLGPAREGRHRGDEANRLARSVADLSQDRREVRILAMGVDTTTPTGKLVINVVGAIRLSLSASEGIAKVTCEGKYRGARRLL